MNILLVQELDLFIECCLECESIFIKMNNDRAANILRDCADLNILLNVFINRKSEIEKPLLLCCLDAWKRCKEILDENDEIPEIERCSHICSMCIEDYKSYI